RWRGSTLARTEIGSTHLRQTCAACASLPGGGFRVLHDQVKTLIITFFRLAGVTANDEDALWMLGRVPDPYMRRYTDWILRARAEDRKYPDGTIVADFVARDCPTSNQASNDSGLGGRSDILGEVKTIQPGKSSYRKGNCQANPPANQRASNVRRNYRKRTVGLDRAHAPEVVGDGTNGQVGPFEEALGQFHTGNVFPIVAGAFSEVNEDASKLVTNLARLHCQDRLWKVDVTTSQPQQERQCLPNHAVTVQARPKVA
ncbi:hypothetical protein THAOC_37744, partial [Thalassiosira oceanica]